MKNFLLDAKILITIMKGVNQNIKAIAALDFDDFKVKGFRVRCAECGCMVTAEEKVKKQKNGNIHRYIYYHCAKRKNPNCTQKCIEEKELEKQIKSAIDKITIPTELHDFALEWLKKENQRESQTTNSVLNVQEKGYKDCLKKLSGLIDMRANGEIDEEEFKLRKLPLTAEKKRWEEAFNKTSQRVDQWLDKADGRS